MWRGRFDEALQESEKARQLDPLSLIIAADNGAILYFSRQYDQAIDKCNSVLQMDPGFLRAHLVVAAYVEKHRFAEALAQNERLRPRVPAAAYWSWRAFILARAGQELRPVAPLTSCSESIGPIPSIPSSSPAHTPVWTITARPFAGWKGPTANIPTN
jgi:tetratricopeptide (TPR) repeat protein